MKKISLILAAASLAFAGFAHAQSFTGSLAFVPNPFVTSTASFTSSSLTLSLSNLITTAESGTFAADVPAHSDLTASTLTISGLSTTALTLSTPVADYFVFSSPDSTLSTSGTSPVNRFSFTLNSLTETAYTGSTADFQGTGTLYDSAQGGLTATPAEFTIGFSGPNNYSGGVAAVPEPSPWDLCLIGVAGLFLFLRRRARRA